MKRYIFIVIATTLLLCLHADYTLAAEYPEIHCKHFFFGYPVGTPSSNDLIIRDIYALSSNDTTKFADWVAYRLDYDTVVGDEEITRNWKADPWLDDSETLEPTDYDGARAALDTDRGHQAPLASFSGTTNWRETNYLSNITPQKRRLNNGPWKKLEGKVRDLASDGNVVYVMTGPLYESNMPSLPEADEPHRIPSGYWKIVLIQEGRDLDSIRTASFIFSQETGSRERIMDHLVTIDEIERRSGLDFLRLLPDELEDSIESQTYSEWAEEHFGD